jgi:hypothetical protein
MTSLQARAIHQLASSVVWTDDLDAKLNGSSSLGIERIVENATHDLGRIHRHNEIAPAPYPLKEGSRSPQSWGVPRREDAACRLTDRIRPSCRGFTGPLSLTCAPVSLLQLSGIRASINRFARFVQQRAWGERRMSRWIVVIMMSAVVISSEALSQQSLRELERSADFEKALRAVDAIKHRKRLQCVISTANAEICGCLARQLPVDTYVRSYVSIVNGDRDGQDYRQLSAADKTIVDRCVGGGD